MKRWIGILIFPARILVESIVAPAKVHPTPARHILPAASIAQGIVGAQPVITCVPSARHGRVGRVIPCLQQLPFLIVAEPVPTPVLHRVEGVIGALLESGDPISLIPPVLPP